MKKNIISLLLILALTLTCVFAFVGCGEEQTLDDNDQGDVGNTDGNGDNDQGDDNQGDDNQGDDNQGDDNQGDDNQGDDNQGDDGQDDTADALDSVAAMYQNSHPTKVTSVSTETLGDLVLNRTDVLTTGTVSGLAAAIYEVKADEMRTIDEGGATSEIMDSTKTVHTITEYLEGMGTRSVNPETGIAKKWNADGVIQPERGAIAITLDKDAIKTYEYKDNVLTFTVAAADTEKVLGYAVGADASVAVYDDGAVITAITISYTVAANAELNVPETKVEISASYSYDIENITIS